MKFRVGEIIDFDGHDDYGIHFILKILTVEKNKYKCEILESKPSNSKTWEKGWYEEEGVENYWWLFDGDERDCISHGFIQN